jgi:putative membrane protein
MEAVLQSLIAGFPVFILHSAVTLAMLAGAIGLYLLATPYKDIALIRQGNVAAAISFSGAVIGLALPLAVCMAASVSVWDIVLWGVVTLLLQILAFRLTDLLLRDLPRRIVAGEIGPALVLVAIKLAVAAINAAAVSG